MNRVNGITHWRVLLVGVAVCLACRNNIVNDSADGREPWLQTHVVPIDNADPDMTEANLSVLRETIGDARLVGLGEAPTATQISRRKQGGEEIP